MNQMKKLGDDVFQSIGKWVLNTKNLKNVLFKYKPYEI